MSDAVIKFPVPASTVDVALKDQTKNGVNFTLNGSEIDVTDSNTPPPPTITGCTVSGPSALQENMTAQYTAKVTGTGDFNPAVTWSCSDGTISQTGLFTAPPKVENVVITATPVADPTKAGNTQVAISNPSNTLKIQASGGDDTTAVNNAMSQAAADGKILEFTTAGGVFHVNPLNPPPAGLQMIFDPGVMFTDQSAYNGSEVMWNLRNSNIKMTGTGAFLQMPLTWAKAQQDKDEYRHCISIGQGSSPAANVNIAGLSINEPGGDGIYFRNCTGLVLSNLKITKAYRNQISCTGQVNGAVLSNITLSAGLRAGFDFEPNSNKDFLINIVINNLETDTNAQGGLSFGPYALDASSKDVSITVNGYVSNNDNGYGIFFTNGNYGNTPGGFIIVNNAIVNNAGFGAAYGRYAASGPQITFNDLVVTNPLRNGVDPHYQCTSACGVELTGGQTGPCGGVTFNVKSISSNNGKMQNYFQTGNQGPTPKNTSFNSSKTAQLSGATNPNAIKSYP